MRKVIDHRLLERVGDPKQMAQRRLERIMTRTDAAAASTEDGLTRRILSLFIPREGVSRPLSFNAVMEGLGWSANEKTDLVQTVLDTLEEEDVLQTDDRCVYQLTSNVLAAQFFNKIEADQMMMRKVENFIHDRYRIYQEKEILLTQPDLNYITPYLPTVSISEKEAAFIQESKESLERRKRRRAWIITMVITALSLLSLVASWQYYRANEALKDAREARIQADMARQDAEKNALLAIANEEKAVEEAARNAQLAVRNDSLKRVALAEARQSARLAAKNEELARKFEQQAIENQRLAEENAQLAEEQAQRAEEQARLAAENADLAAQEAQRAEEKAQLAAKNKSLREIAFSHSLAKQATQLGYDQAEIKALLAHTAYQINVNNEEGDIFQQDIYNALYQSVRSINQANGSENFNRINNERGRIRSIVFAKNGGDQVFYTISSSGYLKKWTVKRWRKLAKPHYKVTTLARLDATLNQLVISDDNKWLAVGGELSHVYLFDLDRLAEKRGDPFRLSLHGGKEIYALGFIPGSQKLVSLGADNRIQQYNIADNTTQTLVTGTTLMTTLAISPDPPHTLYYGTAKGELYEYGFSGIPQELVITSHVEIPKKITAIGVGVYKGQRLLYIGHSNGMLKTLQAKPGGWFPVNRGNVALYQLSVFHTAQIADIQFSPDGRYLGITSYDGRASYWDIDKAINKRYYQPMMLSGESWATAIAFPEGSNHVVVGYREGDLLFFNPDPTAYANAICKKVDRSMTLDEWDLYIGNTLESGGYGCD